MSTSTITTTDIRLRDDVARQLEWDAAVDASAIGVAARDGVITLTGFVDTYAAKLEAERAAKRVRGVRGVANDVNVRLRLGRTDPEIAADAVRALRLRATIPQTVQATVHEGHITLTGRVVTLFQAHEAEDAVRRIEGARGVFSHMEVTHPVGREVRDRIVEALHRDADLDARHIAVSVAGDVATLSGSVASWHQRETAERAAENAPGIGRVVNDIVVEPRDIEEIC